MAMVESPINP